MAMKRDSAEIIKRKMVAKALTDPNYRRLLIADPRTALGEKSLTDFQKREVSLVLAAVVGLEQQINSLADELLCTGVSHSLG